MVTFRIRQYIKSYKIEKCLKWNSDNVYVGPVYMCAHICTHTGYLAIEYYGSMARSMIA